MSKGSFTTLMDVRDAYGSYWFLFGDSWTLSLKPSLKFNQSWATRLLGYRNVPGLGILTTSFVAPGNESVVQRSASLSPELYGPNFAYHEYLPVANFITAVMVHIVTILGNLLLSLPLFRWILRRFLYPLSSGPDRVRSGKAESAEFKAVGFAEGG